MKISKQNLYVTLTIILAYILYYPSIFHELTNWDDNTAVTNNSLIRSLSWPYILRLFTEPYFFNYQPLLNLSYAFEYYFFGVNPTIIHLDNLLLFLINMLLVYKFILLVSGKPQVAIMATLLFAVHPTRIEPLAWATTRSYLLYLSFYLLALIQYIKYLQKLKVDALKLKIKNWHYFLSILFFVFACLCKSTAISLCLTLGFIDYLYKREFNKKVFSDKIPFFLISIFFGIIAIHSVKGTYTLEVFNLMEKIQLAGYSLVFYFNKFILPFNLSTFYPYPYSPGTLPFYYWAFPFLIVLLTGLIFYTNRFTRKIIFAFGFFFSTIILMLQFFAVGDCFAADRYSFVPYIGLFYIVGEGFDYLNNRSKVFLFSARIKLGHFLFATIIIMFSYFSHEHIKVWKNSYVLFSDVINNYPKSFIAYCNRGEALIKVGKTREAIKDLDEAIGLNPKYALSYNNRGIAKAQTGDFLGGLQDLNTAIGLDPNYANSYNNRGNCYFMLKDSEKACADWNKAYNMGDLNAGKAIEFNCTKNYNKEKSSNKQ